jgi:hypothetical protein
MNIIPFVISIKKLKLSIYIFTILLGFSLLTVESNDVFGVELFSKDDQPFGFSYDEWISNIGTGGSHSL